LRAVEGHYGDRQVPLLTLRCHLDHSRCTGFGRQRQAMLPSGQHALSRSTHEPKRVNRFAVLDALTDSLSFISPRVATPSRTILDDGAAWRPRHVRGQPGRLASETGEARLVATGPAQEAGRLPGSERRIRGGGRCERSFP